MTRPEGLAGALALAMLTGQALAQAPRTLSFQGRLEDPVGVPMSGVASLTLRIWDALEGGAALHVETDAVTFADGGVFVTTLGDPPAAALAPADFAQALWVGVTVDELGGGDELSPRLPLQAAPYALMAESARSAAQAAQLAATSPVTLSGQRIIDLASPVSLDDAATRQYVDQEVSRYGVSYLRTTSQQVLYTVAGQFTNLGVDTAITQAGTYVVIGQVELTHQAAASDDRIWFSSGGGTNILHRSATRELPWRDPASCGAAGCAAGFSFVGVYTLTASSTVGLVVLSPSVGGNRIDSAELTLIRLPSG